MIQVDSFLYRLKYNPLEESAFSNLSCLSKDQLIELRAVYQHKYKTVDTQLRTNFFKPVVYKYKAKTGKKYLAIIRIINNEIATRH